MRETVSELRIFRMHRNPKGFLAQEMNTFLCAKNFAINGEVLHLAKFFS